MSEEASNFMTRSRRRARRRIGELGNSLGLSSSRTEEKTFVRPNNIVIQIEELEVVRSPQHTARRTTRKLETRTH